VLQGSPEVQLACWVGLARQRGITADGEHGGLLPGVDDAISRAVAVAVWLGLATGYLALMAATTSSQVPVLLPG
jgi:hypothetical protein